MRTIELTQGKVAMVDDEDYETLMGRLWFAVRSSTTWYAASARTKASMLSMHRAILNAPPGVLVDHADRNGLNNQRYNLRLCNPTESTRNRGTLRTKLPRNKYKGVSWYGQTNRFVARIYVARKEIHLGYYATPEEAALAYNEAAVKMFGKFACLNRIGEPADESSPSDPKRREGK